MKISIHAQKAAESIASYCSVPFQADDIQWFAERIQLAIDAALADRVEPKVAGQSLESRGPGY